MRPIVLAAALLASTACAGSAPGEWPQWRGPRRDNISQETGLLRAWPPEGPPLLWETRRIGDGIAAPAVAAGRAYLLGETGGVEHLTALDAASGRPLWSTPLGPGDGLSNRLMRWLAQRTPTVDEERAYCFRTTSELVCVRLADGAELWRVDYKKAFGHVRPSFGSCDFPLVDGERVIIVSGGPRPVVAALDRRTGRVVWRLDFPEMTGGAHGEYGATLLRGREIVVTLRQGPAGIDADEGRQLWMYRDQFSGFAYTGTPIRMGDRLLIPGRHAMNPTLLRVTGDRAEVLRQWKSDSPFPQDCALVVEGNLYYASRRGVACMDLESGQSRWAAASLGSSILSMTCADGRLYVLTARGVLALLDLDPSEFREHGRLNVPGFRDSMGATHPVVAGGRLYVRDDDRLLCYDVRRDARAPKRPPETVVVPTPPVRPASPEAARAVFVPTPADVVGPLLDLAGVRAEDVVVDLGSGDGRIVIEAAKRGARGVGYEIDRALADLSAARATEAGVAARVRIEARDFFKADWTEATVVVVYLPPEVLEALKPSLRKLRPGTRIVSHQFVIPGLSPARTEGVESREDASRHALHLWTVPPEGFR